MNSSSMRIGIVTYDYDPPIGGQGVYVKSLTHYLRQVGIAHTVFHPPPLSFFKKKHIGPLLFSLVANVAVKQWVKKHHINILHVQVGAGGVLLTVNPGIPVVTTSHLLYSTKHAIHSNVMYLLLKTIEQKTFNQSDAIIATSSTMANEIKNEYGIGATRINTIHYGISPSSFYPKKNKSKTSSILYVGRIEPRKRVLELIRVVSQLKSKHAELELTIIGTGSQENVIHQYLSDYHLGSFIHMLGYKKHENLPDYYRNADLLVVPSSREAFGINVVEALLCGTPVIVAHNSGVADVIANSGCFDVFDDTLSNLSKKIELFLNQPNTLSAESRRVGMLHFDQQVMLKKTIDIYEHIRA